MALEVQQIELVNGSDSEGALILRDGQLVAILAKLSSLHAEAGRWFVEWFSAGIVGFPNYADLDAACAGLDGRMKAQLAGIPCAVWALTAAAEADV